MGKRKNKHSNSVDYHHFLFQRKHWQQGYAKVLREHWYCGAYLPRDTVHRELHSKIHDIPTPNGNVCKRIFEKLHRYELNRLISPSDTPYERLSFLIKELKDSCPATTAMLEWQRDLIKKG